MERRSIGSRLVGSSLHMPLPASIFWTGQAVFWGLFAALPLSLLRAAVFPNLPAGESLAGLMAVRLACGLTASCLLLTLYQHPRIQRLRGITAIAVMAVACCVLVLAEAAVREPLVAVVAPALLPHVQPLRLGASVGFAAWLFTWSLLDQAFRYVRALSVAEAAAQDARLAASEATLALKSSELTRLAQQVEPHFLFNALSAVVACRHDSEKVAEAVGALSEYLRFCLTRSGQAEPLGHELDAIEKLLTVEHARFGADIECQIDASPAARAAVVPPMVVGPLVENAIKYGRLTSPKPLVVMVDARIDRSCLVVTVRNSGSWVERDATNGAGTGLDNLRRRLELADLPGASLTTAAHDGQVVARLTLPAASDGDKPMPAARMSVSKSTSAGPVVAGDR